MVRFVVCWVAVLAALVMAGAASAASWVIQPVPAPVVHDGQLSAVSCASSSACLAVGSFTNSAGSQVTLAERWNGTGWVVQSPPNPAGAVASSLDGVSCSSTSACTAVGSFTTSAGTPMTLAETWNGGSWAIEPTPNPAGTLTSNGFSGVSCTSTSACIAVGTFTALGSFPMMLAERWDGTSWTIQTIPSPPTATDSGLAGVSCTAASACTSVGTFRDMAGNQLTLAEFWNGVSWTLEPTPNNPPPASNSQLNAVSCTGTNACTAVGTFNDSTGTFVTLAEFWNGTSWAIQPTPDPAGASSLTAVSCSSASACTAVTGAVCKSTCGVGPVLGAITSSQGPAVERWNGTSWTIQSTPNPIGASSPELNGVSCAAPGACAAVGQEINSLATPLTLAEGWNGASWAIQTTPNPPGLKASSMSDVACVSITGCTAVGAYGTVGATLTAAWAWNGTGWTLQSTPNPTGASYSALSGVSCTATSSCTAVGHFVNGATLTLAEAWNGASWAIQATPNPTSAFGSSLNAVSCGAAGSCAAVGQVTYRKCLLGCTFTESTLAERWNGTNWAIQTTVSPGKNGQLNDVSCTSTSACVAVGHYTSSGTQVTLAEFWNGTNWTIQSTPNPTGATSSGLTGISCTMTSACTATGTFTNSTGNQLPLGEFWNGANWTIQSTPNPTGATSSSLTAVSCLSASACAAAGTSSSNLIAGQPLAERYS